MLVTGATGFIGRRLVDALVDEGHEVRAMTRHPESYDGRGEPVGGDVGDLEATRKALDGVEVAYYLVHSLDDDDFVQKDAEMARTFAKAAQAAEVRQVIYMGGLGDDDDSQELSDHLRSRREVEHLLAETGVPVTTLRAAIVVGHGGISWEITRQLASNLPAMVVPRWAETKTQPIALHDVIRYLVGVAGREEAYGRAFEVGGTDQLTYTDMLRIAGRHIKGHKVPVMTVPVLTPGLSSRWLALVTDVDVTTGRNLVDSMDVEVLVRDHSIRDLVPGEPMGYEEAVATAIRDREAEPAS
ncbi:NAD(P)H-binding protein [Nocardioides marmoraquaticus]